MNKLEELLKKYVKGEIYFDPLTCHVYSVDASIFEVLPLGIVIPASKEDLLKTVEIASSFKIPLTVRGAATGITGACLGKGLIIDTSKYLNRIIDADYKNEKAVCQPGVVQDNLNHYLSPYDYRLGPDTSTGDRATLGGMLANNAAGARSLHFGKMVDHVLSTELILATGEIIRFHAISDEEWEHKCTLRTTEGNIYRAVRNVKKQYRSEIEKYFPRIPRRVSGYNLDELIRDQPLNLSKLIAGSEGTLGIVTEIQLKIVPKIPHSCLALIFFNDKLQAFRHIPAMLHYEPVAIEMIDDQIIQLGRHSPSLRGHLGWLKDLNPHSLFIVEFAGETASEAEIKTRIFLSAMQEQSIGYAYESVIDSEIKNEVWSLRKAGLGILLSKRTYSRAIAFLEDLSISPDLLAPFMERFCHYLTGKGKTAGIYGHVGAGCMHIRPYINLQKPEEAALMKEMMLEISSLVLEFHGALSGEHGDGLIRSWLNPKMFGEKIMQAFKEIKQAFDPHHLMNPGKIIPLSDQLEELRTQPQEILQSPPTFQDFEREGGFALAVDLCNGNGYCRKKEKIMCPSFQATNEEFHSTRARAQALRSIIHQRLPLKDFTSPRMHDVMDLCISCKGCKTECPSQVDMAKMKAEFLFHYQQEHGYDYRSRFFAHIGSLQKWLFPFRNLINYSAKQRWGKNLLGLLGIALERTLPRLAPLRFSQWFSTYRQPENLTRKVVLFNDTFNEFNYPHIGQAAVRLLNRLGYHVIISAWQCCGRPAISKGFLGLARKQAEKVITQFMPYVKQGMWIVGLEPSCILTLKDDYFGLLNKMPLKSESDKLAAKCLTFEQFLALHLQQEPFPLIAAPLVRQVKVHGHCHQKALVGMQPTLDVLNAIPGFQASEIAAGCCGMAGSFGYEKEHYEISMQIGELALLPAVRSLSPDTLIIANGVSCRQQIVEGGQRRPIHLVEALFTAINEIIVK